MINPLNAFQEILGFGGTMTDSAAINIASLKEDTRQVLMK